VSAKKTTYINLRPATWKQRIYMQERAIEFSETITVSQATELITEYQDRYDEADEQHIMDIDQ